MLYYRIQNEKLIDWADFQYAEDCLTTNLCDMSTLDNEPNYLIVKNGKLEINPNYEQEKKDKERQELDQLSLTPADVERALYKAKGMDFEDLKTLIAEKIPNIDLKGLAIEFRAKDFFRGATASGIRLFDIVGQLLGYTPDDMDYLFQNGELPQ